MKIYFRLEAPFEWVRVNNASSAEQSSVDSFGEVDDIAGYEFDSDDELIGLISGDWVTTHIVELPAKTKKLFNAALPYALEESISEDVENMHFLCPDWKVDEPCHVLAIAKEKMQEWKSLVSEHKLPVIRLIADHSLVPLHNVAECSVALNDGVIYARKNDDFGVTLDVDFLDAWVMDVPVDQTIAVNDKSLTEKLIEENPNRDFRHWEFGSKVVHWLEYPETTESDLWGDQYRPSLRRSGSASPYLIPLMILVFVVVAKIGFDLYQTIALKSEISTIKKEMKISFSDALPDLNGVAEGQERTVMEQALKRLSRQGQKMNLQSMLAAASKVLSNDNITLSDLTFQDGELILTCRLADFSQVDSITKQLNSNSRLTASLKSSEADDGKIIASYLIAVKK